MMALEGNVILQDFGPPLGSVEASRFPWSSTATHSELEGHWMSYTASLWAAGLKRSTGIDRDHRNG